MTAPRLHLRLLTLVLLLLCVGWLALWFYLYANANDTAARDVERQLNDTALSLLLGWNQGQKSADGQGTIFNRELGDLPEFELRSQSGEVMVRSRHFPLSSAQTQALEAGFSQHTINGIRWRVFAVQDPSSGRSALVAVPLEVVAQRGTELASAFLTPLLVALPVFGILICLGIWQGLRPLRQISQKLSEVDLDRLDPLRIDLRGVPREMRAPVLAINHLMRRVRDAMASQRAFTSATGHELRTPLAGFKSQVQVALRANEQADKDRALKKLAGAIDGMKRIVDHLLILARVDPVQPQLETAEIDLVALIEKSLTERENAFQTKALKPALDVAAPDARMRGDATLIGSLIGNLLDNAIRHSPTEGHVWVQLALKNGGLELRISDQGSGIPKEQRENVFENFYREPDQRETGSGLGLGIVRAVVLAHGGSVDIVDGPQQGACFMVWLPKN